MKLGTATSVLFQYGLQDAIHLIARAGFDGVDIWGGRPHAYRSDYSEAELIALRNQIADEGLEVASFMPAFYRYPHSLSSPNTRVRLDSVGYMRACLENAAVLRAPVVLVVPDHSQWGQTREDSLRRFTESVGDVAQHAVPYGLKLGVEVLYHDETDFVNSAADALAIIDEIGMDNLGVVADSGTLNLSKESPRAMIDLLGDRLLQVHVNDNHGGEKQQNLIPGEGSYDFAGLIGALAEGGFSGFLSAELSKEYAFDPEPALKTTAARMRRWMAECGVGGGTL
jgi:protein FrlC